MSGRTVFGSVAPRRLLRVAIDAAMVIVFATGVLAGPAATVAFSPEHETASFRPDFTPAPVVAPLPPTPVHAPRRRSAPQKDRHVVARRRARASPRVPRVRAHVLALGDSVMQGARSQLRARMRSVYVDTAVGRQVSAGIDELERLKRAHRLGNDVLIHLGNNGRFTSAQFSRIVRILAGVRKVVFVNLKVPRDWERSDNNVISAGHIAITTSRSSTGILDGARAPGACSRETATT